jgi:predicted dehydrogenase
MVLAKMQNGAVGTIEMTKIATGVEDELRVEIHGSKGAVRYNGMDAHHLEVYDATAPDSPIGGLRGWKTIDTGQRYPALAAKFPGPKFSIGWMRSHGSCLANFLSDVADGKPGAPGLDHGIHIQHLLSCIRKSIREQRWVEA